MALSQSGSAEATSSCRRDCRTQPSPFRFRRIRSFVSGRSYPLSVSQVCPAASSSRNRRRKPVCPPARPRCACSSTSATKPTASASTTTTSCAARNFRRRCSERRSRALSCSSSSSCSSSNGRSVRPRTRKLHAGSSSTRVCIFGGATLLFSPTASCRKRSSRTRTTTRTSTILGGETHGEIILAELVRLGAAGGVAAVRRLPSDPAGA